MPAIFGDTLDNWAIRLVAAVLAYLLVEWLLPLLANAIGFPIPDRIVQVLAILIAMVIFFARSIRWPRGAPAA